MIEVQVQPLANYHQERERLTRESHAGFKSRREALRNQIASSIPLFGFYRDLLKWLFLAPHTPAPTFESVTIVVARLKHRFAKSARTAQTSTPPDRPASGASADRGVRH